VNYLGAEAEAYFPPNVSVVSATLVEGKNQVRFNLSNGTQVVYDYFMDQWGTNPLQSLVDATIWNNNYCYLQSSGRVMQENSSVFTDAGNFVPFKLTTGWLNLAGLAGLQRIYSMLIVGEYKSPHVLKVSIAYDYDSNPTQIVNISPTSTTTPGVWGSDSTWGSSSVWGGGYPAYTWRVDFTRQKCTAIQITIEDVQTANFGEGMSLSGLTFEVGIKPGTRQLPATSSFGGTS
jgi:hypothetical protein